MNVTEDNLAEAYAKRCKRCRYRGPKGGMQLCDYILITGHRRGCSIAKCDKFEPGKRVGVSEPPNSPIQRKRRAVRKRTVPLTPLGREIDRYQTERKVTNAELASLIGVNKATISKWRNGSKPQETQVIRLSEILGINVRDLME